MRIVPRFELRKKDHVTDAFLAEEHDAKAVDSYAYPAGRGHAVFKSYQKIFIKFRLLTASLLLEAFALLLQERPAAVLRQEEERRRAAESLVLSTPANEAASGLVVELPEGLEVTGDDRFELHRTGSDGRPLTPQVLWVDDQEPSAPGPPRAGALPPHPPCIVDAD